MDENFSFVHVDMSSNVFELCKSAGINLSIFVDPDSRPLEDDVSWLSRLGDNFQDNLLSIAEMVRDEDLTVLDHTVQSFNINNEVMKSGISDLLHLNQMSCGVANLDMPREQDPTLFYLNLPLLSEPTNHSNSVYPHYVKLNNDHTTEEFPQKLYGLPPGLTSLQSQHPPSLKSTIEPDLPPLGDAGMLMPPTVPYQSQIAQQLPPPPLPVPSSSIFSSANDQRRVASVSKWSRFKSTTEEENRLVMNLESCSYLWDDDSSLN